MRRKKLLHLLGIGCVSFAAGIICGRLAKERRKNRELEEGQEEENAWDYLSDNFYYGRNRQSKMPVILNRKEMPYYGSGVLTGAGCLYRYPVMKREMENVLMHTKDDVILVSYSDGFMMNQMLERFNGTVVDAYRNSLIALNPMQEDSKDSLSAKIEEVKALFRTWLSDQGETLRQVDEKVIEESMKTLYEQKNHPTLEDLLEELKRWPNHGMVESLQGITDYFHATDAEEGKSRLTVYNMNGVFRPDRSAELAMITCIGNAWERVCENTRNGKHTWLYIADCTSDIVEKIEPYVTKLMKSGKKCTMTLTCVKLPFHEGDGDAALEHNFGIFFPSGDESDSEAERLYALHDEDLKNQAGIRPGNGIISYVPHEGAGRTVLEFSF